MSNALAGIVSINSTYKLQKTTSLLKMYPIGIHALPLGDGTEVCGGMSELLFGGVMLERRWPQHRW